MEDPAHFAALLQSCISPMLLISGVGLVLLTLANRLSHAIDRVRMLSRETEDAPPDRRGDKLAQLRLLFQRCRILRASVVCVVMSILCSALIILCLFGIYFAEEPLQRAVMGLFALSLLCVIGSAALLLWDVSKNLAALQVEVQDHFPSVDQS
jgi:hypothetical protein